MHEARVLVVDDSAAMRALFSDLLDQAKNVRVVGTANGADDARRQIEELHPNVLTLDVEMPGMSGIEFLAEIMETNPLPVVMLSSLTQSGAETSLKAYELGAVECFPKPLRATPEQFAKTVGKLGKIVLAAANSNVRDRKKHGADAAKSAGHFEWNGHLLALSASMGGIDALSEIFPLFPEMCPPTVVVLSAEPMVVETFINRLSGQIRCAVKPARDGAVLEPGTIHIAADPATHVVVEPGQPARLRLLARDPVDGARPSATLLFGTIARAGMATVAAVLTGMGEDGAKGLKLLRDAGQPTFAQERGSATVAEAPAAAIAMGAVDQELALEPLALAMLSRCSSTGSYTLG